MGTIERQWVRAMISLGDAAVTMIAVVLAWLAFHDITTDTTATSFHFEYTFLTVIGIWLAILGIRLYLGGARWLGAISLVSVGAALWGQAQVGQGIATGTAHYLAVVGAFVWFTILSCMLLVRGWFAPLPTA